MRVAYDPQTFLRQSSGGISRLFTEIIHGFFTYPDFGVTPEIPFKWITNDYAARSLADAGLQRIPKAFPKEILYLSWILKGMPSKGNWDLLHHTYYSKRFLSELTDARRVLTVYDMIPEIFRGSKFATRSHLAKRRYVERSDLVICISESTRQDLLDVYGTIRAQTVVIPPSVDERFQPGLPALPGLPGEYLLYVGKRQGYKDFSLLVHSLFSLKREVTAVPLVVIGDPLNSQERRLIRRFGLDREVIHLRLGDDLLPRVYANCAAVVQTSRYEGFGLTPLEGMASGVPVVVARSSSMPEVCGDAAFYFEPGKSDDLTRTLSECLGDPQARESAKAKGLEQSERFSTRKVLKQLSEAYRMLVETPSL